MIIPVRRLIAVSIAGLALLTPACVQQMADHAGYKPLTPSGFFADGRSARPTVPGTVARGQLRTDTVLYEGRDAKGNVVTEFPFEMTRQVLERGRERYNVWCSVCHGLTGEGDGRIVQRGFTWPPNLHTDLSRYYEHRKAAGQGESKRLTEVPVGHIYEVIYKGYGAMPSYHSEIPPRDRWAIVGYVKALQYARSPELRKQLPAAFSGATATKDKGGAK